jgi:hypothetical protein
MRAPHPPTRAALLAGAAFAALAGSAVAGAAARSQSATTPAAATELVACRLPPQIHTLGRNVTYLSAGRQVQVSVAECKQRGGTWNGHGPGAYAGASTPLAVTVGAGANGPACPLQATVTGLHGGSLAVRSGPGTKFERTDRLDNGARVFLCDRAGDAGWVGIVYGSGDCGLAAPIDPPHAYSGACRSGWVRSSYLR